MIQTHKKTFPKIISSALFSTLLLFLVAAALTLNLQSCEKKQSEDENETPTELPISEISEGNDLPLAAADGADGELELPTAENTENTDDVTTEATPEPTEATTQRQTASLTNNNALANKPSDGKYYSYLSGLECTKEEQRKRPIAVMINNIKPALPNVGTSHADIIYECIVEGGQTRLMLLLTDYEDVPVYGSVRSSRDYYIDLLQAHDAIYVHAGGTDMAYVNLRDRQINRLDGVNPVNGVTFPNTFYRDAARRRTMALEHTLMASGAGIVAGIKQMNYRTTLKEGYNGTLNFYTRLTDMGVNGSTANYVCVPYSNGFQPEFIYDPDDGLYYRKQYGAPHIDAGNNEQLRFQNVIILFADYTDLRMKNGYLACNLTGTGYGFYISHGKYKIIKWQKATRDSIYNLYNLNDTPLSINAGKTFISVTSTVYNRSVVINDEIRDYK